MTTFIDTNILVYAVDPRDAGKQALARAALRHLDAIGRGVVSTQILLELHSARTGQLRMPAPMARALVQATAQRYLVVQLSSELILRGLDLHILRQLSHWDACVVVAAASAGCRELLSEDLQDGACFEGVTVRNPFAGPTATPS